MPAKTTSKSKRKNTSTVDYTTKYAQSVVEGKIVVGPWVMLACRRHLLDLQHAHERGLVWDVEAAQDAIEFFTCLLFVEDEKEGVVPFPMFPWQAFCTGSVFGWKNKEGHRRFGLAYIETGKGSGKSPMLAGWGLYGLTGTGKYGQQIYSAATKKEQAALLFKDAVLMVRNSPLLAEKIEISGAMGKEYNLARLDKNSFFRPTSSDKAQSGARVAMGLVDELHEHRDATAMNMLTAGTKKNKDALVAVITNSGSDTLSVCGEYHEKAVAALEAAVLGTPDDAGFNDGMFCFVCALDEADKEEDKFLENEACWVKANPSLEYGLPGYKYLRDQVRDKRGMPSGESELKRLNFCIWTEANNPFVSAERWKSIQDSYTLESLKGRRCYGGLDLSATTDLTAFVLLFEPTAADPFWRIKPWFWLPKVGLADREVKDNVPYLLWESKGYLLTTPGAAIDPLYIAQTVQQLCKDFDVQTIGYDLAMFNALKTTMDREGIALPLAKFGQGFLSMTIAVDQFERLLVDGKIKHDGHPILRWNMANAVIAMNPAGGRKPDKSKATKRIDGFAALLDAIGMSVLAEEPALSGSFFVL